MNDTTPRPDRAVTLRPRRPGEIMRAALELYQRQLLTLIASSAVLVAPIALLALFAVVAAVTTRAVTAQLAGQDPGLRASVRSSFARPRPLLQVVILVVGSMAVLVLLMLPGMSLTGSGGPLANAVVGVTLVLLVAAGRARKEPLDLDTLRADLQALEA